MSILFVICLTVLLNSGCMSAQSPCQTPNNKNGTCIEWTLCDNLARIARRFNAVSRMEQNFFRQSKCGGPKNNPMVCCELRLGLRQEDFPAPGTCGSQSKERIYNGQEAPLTDYRWFALIQYTKVGKTPKYYCGGSLINKDYVLTAAHCMTDRRIIQSGYTPTTIRLGEHDLQSDRDCLLGDDETYECADPVVDVPIAEKIIHKGYDTNSRTKDNDIALIRLQRSIGFTFWIRPVCLPFAQQLRNKNFDNITLTVVGFGLTERGMMSDIKLEVDVEGTNWDYCNSRYKITYNTTLTSKQLCASGEQGSRKDSCNGDSGGPLMGLDKTDVVLPYLYLAGIVSRGPNVCGMDGIPAIYTRTDKFLDWIMDHMRP